MKQMQLPFIQSSTEGESESLKLLRNGASLVLSVSGGKDSDAMCHYLLDLHTNIKPALLPQETLDAVHAHQRVA